MKNQLYNRFMAIAAVLALAGVFSPGIASAQQQVKLEGSVMVERTINENGEDRTVLSTPEQVVPGDKLVFATSFRNSSNEAVENFVVTNPLPLAVRLAAQDGSFEVSVNGGDTYGQLNNFSVETELGEERAAQLTDVTHIRWTLARLEPGASGSLEYQAIVR